MRCARATGDRPLMTKKDPPSRSRSSSGRSKHSKLVPVADPTSLAVASARSDRAFPIVGIGASAGGLEAFSELLHEMPLDTGMAFVLVQHLDPTHHSMLTEILSRATAMPVAEVREDTPVLPNHVYVCPPGKDLTILRGVLQVAPRAEPRGQHRSVDNFMRSLAIDQRHGAIGVILSGSATDGTLGLEEIKAEGGITFAQDNTAKHDSMPRSVIAAGCVDFILSPADIARELSRIARHPYTAPEDIADPGPESDLAPVLHLLHERLGVDFTHYKRNTLYRRITRRMVLHKTERLENYVTQLADEAREAERTHPEGLINVT